jgi:RsiW-degrading membrane proteinase PrsW (M82 family)
MGAVVFLLVCLSTLVVLCYLLVIWWLDRYEREPLWLVGLTFMWGGLFGTCFSCLINSTMSAMVAAIAGAQAASAVTAVVVAPVVEEFMKGAVFLPLLLIGKNVDNRTDGLIYGAATGLGFATVENLHYYSNNYDPNNVNIVLFLIVIRTLFCAFLHCSSSAMLGMAIGHARHRTGILGGLVVAFVGYCFAMGNHALWNLLSTIAGMTSGGSLLIGMFIMLGVAALMFTMTQLSLWAEHRDLSKHLLEEARRGTLPEAHAQIIPFWLKRGRSGWLPPHVNRAAYVKAATLLAFRLGQMELASPERRPQYMEDITALRAEVRSLLAARR